MSRPPLRTKRPSPTDPPEQPSVSQVYYPDDMHRLFRQIESNAGNLPNRHQPTQKLQICNSELEANSAENSTEPAGPSLIDPLMEQVEQNNLETQTQNLMMDEAQEQLLLQDEPPPNNILVVNNSQRDTPEVIDLEKLPAMPSGSSAIVDLTVDMPNQVNVVDLTMDMPVTPVQASPVIVCVSREPEERPSCRFAAQLPRQRNLFNDDIQELPCVQNPGGESRKADEDVDPTSKKAITCPVCLDDYKMIKKMKRQLMSTICGHIFCDKCIKGAVRLQSKCPTCRKKLSQRHLHPIFI